MVYLICSDSILIDIEATLSIKDILTISNLLIDIISTNCFSWRASRSDIDFVKLIKMITKEEKRRSKNKKVEIPMRPDHGHCLLDDQKKKKFNRN